MTADEIGAAAQRLEEAERTRRQIRMISLEHPGMTLDDAYRVQQAWVEMKVAAGRRVRGHKIGLTSRAMRQALGIETPDSGILLDDMFFADGGTVPTARFIGLRIEAELAFVLKHDLAGPDATIFEVLDATAYVSPALCFPFGGIAAEFYAGYIIPAFGWRALFLVGGVLPVLWALLLVAIMPESARFPISPRQPLAGAGPPAAPRRPRRAGRRALQRSGRDGATGPARRLRRAFFTRPGARHRGAMGGVLRLPARSLRRVQLAARHADGRGPARRRRWQRADRL